MKCSFPPALGAAALLACFSLPITASAAPVTGWLSWRGPRDNGTSLEKNLPDKIDVKDALWTADFPGESTPVIANGKLYVMGYLGAGADLREGVACFDAETGQKLWQQLYPDFLSDTIYLRYASSSPTIDPETGNVCIQGSQGIFASFTPDGKKLWEHSLMELYGRLTFPNARTASPAFDDDLVITRGITANWGAQGPGADRFYAFDKKTGEIVWASNPGGQPKDNSFSHPVFANWKGIRVFYSATGDGSVVCVNARTGEPLWRVNLFKAGINSSVLLYQDDTIIAIFGTPYEPGQMVAMEIPDVLPQPMSAGPVTNAPVRMKWHNEVRTSSSSPILVGEKVYVVSETGNLVCVNANTGVREWVIKLGIEQRNACPIFADGRLYIPVLDEPGLKNESSDDPAGGKGAFYIINPDAPEGQKIISHTVLDGRCLSTATVWNGKIYVQTSRHLYCFGRKGGEYVSPEAPAPARLTAGPAAQLQIIPSEVLLHPGQTVSFRVRELDANGLTVGEVPDLKAVKWSHFIPRTAKVRASMTAEFNGQGELTAGESSVPSAGAFEASLGNLKGYFRGRVLPGLPIKQDFEGFSLTETNASDGSRFAYPPLPWIGARFKFEIQDKDGSKVMAKTVNNAFFRRATVFMGDPRLKNYTIEADVMSDGNLRRHKMSEVGLINQRYRIVLKGNDQKLEVTSNEELFHQEVDFKWTPSLWYHLKTRVDVAPDGSGVVRAKAWKKSDPEPEAWTIEVPMKSANPEGCPGLFGFSPQDMRCYLDNILVTAN